MTEGTSALYETALKLSASVDANFLELGHALLQLFDRDPDLFYQLAANANLGLRKAYDLIEVSRTFEPLAIPRERLRKIGWPKLQFIAKHVAPNTLDALLQLAEDSTAKELERRMRGENSLGNARCVLMYFSPKDYADLDRATEKYGMTTRVTTMTQHETMKREGTD